MKFFVILLGLIVLTSGQLSEEVQSEAVEIEQKIEPVVSKVGKIKPVVTVPVKLSWKSSLGIALKPLAVPGKFLSKLLIDVNKIMKVVADDASRGRSIAHMAVDGSKMKSGRSRRDLANMPHGQHDEDFATNAMIATLRNILQRLTTNINTLLIENYNTNELLNQIVVMTEYMKPTFDYLREEILPSAVMQLIRLQKSEYASQSTIEKIDNVKQAYKLLALLGYVPPLKQYEMH